jgi:predicted ATPase
MAGSGFIGREAELAETVRLLGEARLVTLTGVGGVGKTRLAREAAERMRPRFPDGVHLVELSALRSAELLPAAVAAALGLADQSTRPHLDVLAEWLAGRSPLLVLDTCEHLVRAARELARKVLAAAPGVRILVTTREPLGLGDERVLKVMPLPVADAVELLRARTGRGEQGMDELCGALDCLPLALELAAARLRDMSVAELTRQLDDRFRHLAGDHRDGPARHATLRSAIGWSHELCGPDERLIWARCSVFAGDFDREAVMDVCAGGPLSPSAAAAAITGLVDKSILMETRGEGGRARYRMLDTIREYGAEWLHRLRQVEATRARHRDHYLRLARRAESEWQGRQLELYGRLREERANLWAAFDYCMSDPEQHRAGLDLAGTLWPLWMCCGLLREGRHYLDLTLSVNHRPGPERLKALWVSAWVAIGQGDIVAVEAYLDQCRREDVTGDAAGHVSQMTALGAILRGDAREALAAVREARHRHRAEHNVFPGLLLSYTVLGMALLMTGDLDDLERVLDEGRLVAELYDEHWIRTQFDYLQAQGEHRQGRTAAALKHAREAARGARRFADLTLLAPAVELIAALRAAEGRPEAAAILLGVARGIWDRFGLADFGAPLFRSIRDEAEERVRRVLPPERIAGHFAEGNALDLDTALAYVLGESDRI